mgnify:CR=1 FL=1|tara:strand:- start:41659 stop:43089 length:1431 start_codon:yes stop_codon:yes gene_type:complete
MNLKDLIIGSLNYGVVRYFSSALGLLRAVIMAIYLGPELLGIYSIVILITEFLNYINLGVFFSMTRDIALSLEEKKPIMDIRNIMGSALSFSLMMCCVLLAGLFLIFFSTTFITESKVYDYLPYLFFLVLSCQFKHFTQRYLQVFDHFLLLGFLELLAQIINTVLVFFFIQQYLIEAILISIIASNLILAIIGLSLKAEINFKLDQKIVKNLIITGIPILIYNIFTFIVASADRAMIAFYYKQEIALGYFQLAFSLALGIFVGFRALSFIIQPRIFRRFRNQTTYQSIERQTHYLETILVFMSLVGILVLPFIIKIFISDYEISIRIMQFLLVAFTINGLSYFHSSYLIANKRENVLIPPLILALVVAVLGNIAATENGYGLYGIAFSKVLAFGIYGLVIQLILSKEFSRPYLKDYFLTYYRSILLFLPLSYFIYKEISIFYAFIFYIILYRSSLIEVYQNIFIKYSNYLSKSEIR